MTNIKGGSGLLERNLVVHLDVLYLSVYMLYSRRETKQVSSREDWVRPSVVRRHVSEHYGEHLAAGAAKSLPTQGTLPAPSSS